MFRKSPPSVFRIRISYLLQWALRTAAIIQQISELVGRAQWRSDELGNMSF